MRFMGVFSFGLVVAAAAVPAAAQQFYGGFRPYSQGQYAHGQGQGPAPQRGMERSLPQRDARGAGEADRGRMSPDERRQLRRDIQDAGRDIYHPARQAPREPRERRRSGGG